jgi:hypothetical protein
MAMVDRNRPHAGVLGYQPAGLPDAISGHDPAAPDGAFCSDGRSAYASRGDAAAGDGGWVSRSTRSLPGAVGSGHSARAPGDSRFGREGCRPQRDRDRSYGMPAEMASRWLQDNELSACLSEREHAVVAGELGDAEPDRVQVEAINALAWILGIVGVLDPSAFLWGRSRGEVA